MTIHGNDPNFARGEVVVHGNGLLAKVRAFEAPTPGGRPISLDSLLPNEAIRSEMMTEQGEAIIIPPWQHTVD